MIVDEGPIDRELTWFLLREHKKGIAGIARAPAPALASAPWGAVEAYFIRRLKAMKVRIDAAVVVDRAGELGTAL